MLDGLKFVKTPALLAAAYGDCLWKVPTDSKILYLTFDDGPTAGATEFVLDELARRRAKATFFCIGKNVEANPELFAEIRTRGNTIGNHTYDHLNGWLTGSKIYYENIWECKKVFESKSVETNLFRPPYGKLKPGQYQYLRKRHRIVMWDVLTYDFDPAVSPDQVYRNAVDHAESGSIIVFHDSLKAKENLKYALPRVLEYFSERGFTFERL